MSSLGSKLTTENVAAEIQKNKDQIVLLFIQKLKERVELPPDLDEQIFTHSIPFHIEKIIQSLTKYALNKNSIEMAEQERSKLRVRKGELPLEIIISEFIILKDLIFEVLERKGKIENEASNIIWRNIVNSIQEAASQYEKNKILEVKKISNKLEDSDAVNKNISEQIAYSRENEERYKTLVEGLEDYAVFTIDPKGFITSWNPGARRMKGYTSEEAIGRHVSIFYPEIGKLKDEPMNHLHVALIEGRYRGEGMRVRKNGEHFLADVYIRPIFEGSKHLGFAKVVADLTERNKLIQSANISETKIVNLKTEKELRESFVLKLAHDLRGPLTVTRAAVELIRKESVSEKALRFSDKAIVSIDRINRMIADLLDANRMSAGVRPTLKLQSWDLIRLARNVCDDFRMLGNGIELQIEGENLTGKWDGEGIRRILENLINNAVKYGDNHYPVVVTLQDLEKSVSIQVHNMGEVIQSDDQKSLFDQFSRNPSGKHKAGWGIGLSLVKGITEAHGGSVEVESYPIEGTTFTITLPKFAAESTQNHAKKKAS